MNLKQYKPLASLREWEDNYNHGDVEAIALSIRRFGMNSALRVWRDEIVMAGNHTLKALRLIQEQGAKPKLDHVFPPQNIVVKGNEWFVQYVDVSHLEPLEAKAYAIADNNLARQAVTDDQKLAEYLQEIMAGSEQAFKATGYNREGLNALLTVIGKRSLEASEVDITPDAQKKKKLRAIDIIYTAGTMGRGGDGADLTRWIQVHCCLAVKSGWMYGVRSTAGVCGTAERQEAHVPQFVDNDYHNYNHIQHLGGVKRWKPKYATVCDLMTREQCDAAGIPFHPIEQILDWAEEISAHAENVILIPKYDCFDQIPDKPNYMLGYSVPTSYGGTPLPIEMFKGRRVHLLGGSPRRQIQYFQALQDDVVSLDNNYILKISAYGQVYLPNENKSLALAELRLGMLVNPLYSALTLNLGLFAGYFERPMSEDASVLLSSFETDLEEFDSEREAEHA